jgi:hypothetical protein
MPKVPRPRPGSLPLPKPEAPAAKPEAPAFDARTLLEKGFRPPWDKEAASADIHEAAQRAFPTWMTEEPRPEEKVRQPFTALQKARRKAEELAGVVRSDAFSDWVRRCMVPAKVPSEWTQARTLYESYVAHAWTYGLNRSQRKLSGQELATETQWGRA